ncbi:DUF6345 domain-containing protein [Methanothrix sp.]|jgi:hypothetical protein|uniref:DUF6345 domain-containing protein n=1 Tax=Methanothrix sp. TaxID=90426 RepID=UPI003BB794D0
MTISLKNIANDCLGISGTFSAIRDIFAYDQMPKKIISLKEQIRIIISDCRHEKATFGIQGIRYFDRVNESGYLSEKCVELPYTFNVCNGLYRKLVEAGHVCVFYLSGDDCWEAQLRSEQKGGIDDQVADNVDLFFVSSHGNNVNGQVRVTYNVKHDAWDAKSENWRLGDRDLEWLMVYACSTINMEKFDLLWHIFQRLHMFCGNWGDAFDSFTTDEVGEDLGENLADGDPVSRAWIDALSDWAVDNHPAVLAAERREACKYDGDLDWPNTTMNQDHLWGHGKTVKDIIPRDICQLSLLWAEG